jgi:hypothetical protein
LTLKQANNKTQEKGEIKANKAKKEESSATIQSKSCS